MMNMLLLPRQLHIYVEKKEKGWQQKDVRKFVYKTCLVNYLCLLKSWVGTTKLGNETWVNYEITSKSSHAFGLWIVHNRSSMMNSQKNHPFHNRNFVSDLIHKRSYHVYHVWSLMYIERILIFTTQKNLK